jgi:hypothetical protein
VRGIAFFGRQDVCFSRTNLATAAINVWLSGCSRLITDTPLLLSLTDAVEKVRSMPPARNIRIVKSDLLNRYCVFDAGLESMLLEKPRKIVFQQHRPKVETVSVCILP